MGERKEACMARKLHNCAEENSYPNKSAEPYFATIWDRLSPDERRIINGIRDRAGNSGVKSK